MAVMDTPWFVGAAGVLHPAETARAVAYAACGGSDGVIGVSDFKVTATPTPSNQVRLAPGGVSLVSRYNGATSQAYAGVLRATDYITIDPTTSSGGRSDLIIARIHDPQYGGEPTYDSTNANDFKFFTVEVLKGVAKTTKRLTGHGYPGMALARIDIPASTATITNAMITDLRFKSNRKTDMQKRTVFPTKDFNMNTGGDYARWTDMTAWFDVPMWANKAQFNTVISSIEFTGTSRTVAGVRTAFGTASDSQNSILVQTSSNRFTHTHLASFNLDSSFQGVDVGLVLQATRTSGTGTFQVDYQSSIQVEAFFSEEVT